MKILYYSPHPHLNLTDKTGYGTHMREMIQAFRDLGHEVLPVINGGTEPRPLSIHQSTKNAGGIKKIIKSIIPKYIWRSFKDRRILQFDKKAEIDLGNIVNEFKPDLIYERAYYLQVSGVNVASRKKIRHFLEVNAPYVDETFEFEGTNSIYTAQATKAEELQLQLSDRVFVVSSPLKDYFIKKYSSIKADKLIVTPNCVNPDKVKVDQNRRNQIIEKYQLTGNTVVGFIGSIFPYHGVDKMITAFNEVYKHIKAVKLLIVGDGLILNELKSFARTLEAGNNIIFTGNVPNTEVFSYIDVMDITVLATTEWYCSPIKLFEYGALGKAVIAPDIPAIHDVMVNGKDGLLVTPDKEQLAKALATLINNRPERETIGISFKTKVESNYTWLMNARLVLSNLNSELK